jgi:putative transposase
LVDVNGLVLRAAVHAADMQDRAGVSVVLDGAQLDFPRIELIWADQGYTGGGKTWIEEQLGWRVEIVQHAPRSRGKWTIVPDADDPTMGHFEWIRFPPARKAFRGVLPRRWVAETTQSQYP